MAGTGLVITILALASKYFQLDVDEGQITEGVEAVAQGVGFILVIIGQIRRRDLKMGLIRK